MSDACVTSDLGVTVLLGFESPGQATVAFGDMTVLMCLPRQTPPSDPLCRLRIAKRNPHGRTA